MHVPFCFHKCPYCDYYALVGEDRLRRAFTDRLSEELRALGRRPLGPVRSIFVGGGTPTVLSPVEWERLLAAIHEALDLSALTEFTVEANPESVDRDRLAVLTCGGVDRLSIGAQSFAPGKLRVLERSHAPSDTARAVDLARRFDVEKVNLELLFGVSGETRWNWREDLRTALALDPPHVTCTALSESPETPLGRRSADGDLVPCDDATVASMDEEAVDRLGAAGLRPYEITHFARPGRASEHNLSYGLGERYLAAGPGAAGHVDGVRWKNLPDIGAYLASEGGAPLAEVERLGPDERFGEQLMLRLRRAEGIPRDWVESHIDARRSAVIDESVRRGLLERTADHVRLTRRGRHAADDIAVDLL